MVPDGTLMLRAQGGDDAAFGLLVQRYGALVQHTARQVVRHAAEDVAQQTFLSAWLSRARYDPARGSVRSWLCGIAYNRAVDAHRREARQVAQAPIDEVGDELVCPLDSPPVVAGDRARASEVRRAVARLGPEQRTVIGLAYFGGLSQREIQLRTGAPLGTVKSRSRLALSRLREDLPAAA